MAPAAVGLSRSSDPGLCEEGLARVAEKVGPVDILVNDAGITRDATFHRGSFEQWSAVIRTKLDSMFTMTRPVIAGMRERGWGRVINFSSINGPKGQFGQANSSAEGRRDRLHEGTGSGDRAQRCDGELHCAGLYRHRGGCAGGAAEIVRDIPVNRLGQADEIAAAVVYLASEQAGFMTGATLAINGGQHLA